MTKSITEEYEQLAARRVIEANRKAQQAKALATSAGEIEGPARADGKSIVIDYAIHLKAPAANPKGQDVWTVTLRCQGQKQAIDIEYSTGVGHRQMPAGTGHSIGMTVHQWEKSLPKAPDVKGFLACVGSDLTMLLDLPHDDINAIDELDSNIGPFRKPGEALRLLRALRENADKVSALLRFTGVSLGAFAEWAVQFDN